MLEKSCSPTASVMPLQCSCRTLARDLRMNAGRKHLSGMAVAQIVEADMGPLGRLSGRPVAVPARSTSCRLIG
jgi:hypothetical protein